MNDLNTTNFTVSSVVSYPNRDNRFGNNSYRGNCTGLLIKDMINFFKPKLFVDACEGSGTSRDVCKALGINYVGLDLRYGNDFTKMSIAKELPHLADLCFTHPPYHDMIKYSGQQWNKGQGLVEGDTSHCKSVDEFLAMSQVMLLNQREATRNGGVYATCATC
jgi:DNA modification methylase